MSRPSVRLASGNIQCKVVDLAMSRPLRDQPRIDLFGVRRTACESEPMTKLPTSVIVAIALSLSGCGPSNSEKPPAKVDQATASQGDGQDGTTDWQLEDDSTFTVTIEPWPPKEGDATIKAAASMDDDDREFRGSVQYRVAASEQNSDPWKPLPQVGVDEVGDVRFAASVKLSKGTFFVQFRVRDKGDPKDTDLTDWKIDVK